MPIGVGANRWTLLPLGLDSNRANLADIGQARSMRAFVTSASNDDCKLNVMATCCKSPTEMLSVEQRGTVPAAIRGEPR